MKFQVGPVFSGQVNGWEVLARIINCHMREFLYGHVSRGGKSKEVESALKQAPSASYRQEFEPFNFPD